MTQQLFMTSHFKTTKMDEEQNNRPDDAEEVSEGSQHEDYLDNVQNGFDGDVMLVQDDDDFSDDDDDFIQVDEFNAFRAANRLIGRMLVRNPDGNSEEHGTTSSSEEEEEEDRETEREHFDTELPTRHDYLGESREVSGRTILEEDLVQEIPILSQPGVILVPGQTLPLTFFHPSTISLMKKLLETTKTFGVVNVRYLVSGHGTQVIDETSIGTTAEIYEYRESPEEGNEVGFKVKARGRQRFKILNVRRQVDGNRVATVEILPEVTMGDIMYPVRLRCRDKFRPFPDHIPSAIDDEVPSTSQERRSKSPLRVLLSKLKPRNKSQERENKLEFRPKPYTHKNTKFNHLRSKVYGPPLLAFPHWVYEMYDPKVLVERLHEALGKLRLFSQTEVAVPTDPTELSFWVASNLPLTDNMRLKLLEINNSVQRLRCAIGLLESCQIFVCQNCGQEIARQDDIFSMSREGPQGAYVNPGGYVHETLTLYKVRNIRLIGRTQTEYSWFPGYAWTTAQCRYCDSHLGWKFDATNKKLSPRKFWGISRRNIQPQFSSQVQPQFASQDSADSIIRPVM